MGRNQILKIQIHPPHHFPWLNTKAVTELKRNTAEVTESIGFPSWGWNGEAIVWVQAKMKLELGNFNSPTKSDINYQW
jgi:hypothetical protein